MQVPAVIVNPASAGGRTAKLWPRLEKGLESTGLDFVTLVTTGPSSAMMLTRQALQQGAQLIVAVGGDGTVNEVINGFFIADEPINPEAHLAVVPSGTGHDLSKTLGIRPGLAALSCLTAGHEQSIDLGRATFRDLGGRLTQRYFVNVADLGLGADTVQRLSQTTKVFGGFLAFLYGAIGSILRYRIYEVELTIDDQPPFLARVGTVLLGNGRYFGGGMEAAPKAKLDDGYLDLVTLGDAKKRELLFSLLPKVYRGRHLDHPCVSWQFVRRVVVRARNRVLLEMDGELVGTADATIEVVPRALKILTPAPATTEPAKRKSTIAIKEPTAGQH